MCYCTNSHSKQLAMSLAVVYRNELIQCNVYCTGRCKYRSQLPVISLSSSCHKSMLGTPQRPCQLLGIPSTNTVEPLSGKTVQCSKPQTDWLIFIHKSTKEKPDLVVCERIDAVIRLASYHATNVDLLSTTETLQRCCTEHITSCMLITELTTKYHTRFASLASPNMSISSSSAL